MREYSNIWDTPLLLYSVFVSCILIDYIIKNTIYKILPNTPKFLINIEHYFKIKT